MAPFSRFLTVGPAPARQILGGWGRSPQIISSRFPARKGCNRAPSRHNIAGVLSYSVSRKLAHSVYNVATSEIAVLHPSVIYPVEEVRLNPWCLLTYWRAVTV